MGRLGHPELDARYEVLKLVDTGGTSQVYLAQDRRLNCQWAIKKTQKRSQAINTVISEVNILKSLNHPALPRIVDIREDNDYFYIVMDYIQGENLRTILRSDGPQPQESVVSWGISLCDVMTYLHSHNVIYRDMKPSNVMLTPDGQIKLIDFGIAREYNPDAKEDTVALGTEGYAAPEQYEGHGQSDERTDVFGIGVTLFQLLTDINPATYSENLFSIRLSNPSLSSGLDKIILKCTNKSKEKRYQNAEALKNALLNYKELDNEYIREKTHKRKKIITMFSLSGLCFILAAGSFVFDYKKTGMQYDSLIADTQNPKNIESAVELKPEDSRAYIALLDSYGEVIDQNEAADFSHVYAEHQAEIKDKNEVSMYAGEKILTSYEEQSLRSKLLIAENYFKVVDKDYEKFSAANAYVNMANFYKNFIMQQDGTIVKEASKKEYETLLSDMSSVINSVSKYEGTEQKNLLLTTCELTLNLINEQADSMQEQNVSRQDIESVATLARDKTSAINPKVETTQIKKNEIIKLYSVAEKSIADAYSEKNKK